METEGEEHGVGSTSFLIALNTQFRVIRRHSNSVGEINTDD